MRISFKVIGLHILSLSLLVSGCGDNSSFKPLVTKDAKFTIATNLDKDQAFKIVDAYLKMVSDMHILEGDDLDEVRKKIEACKKDIFACGDWNKNDLVSFEKLGLRDAELAWAVWSMEDCKIVRGEPRPYGISVAIGGKFDLEKAIDGCKGLEGFDVNFEMTEIEGEKAWHIVPKDDAKAINELQEMNLDPYVASLGGQLTLLAMSRDTLAKQIRLYRKGAGKGDALIGFSAAKGELARIQLSGIGEFVKQNVPQDALCEANEVVSGGDKIVAGLQSLTIDTNVNSDGTLSGTIRLKAGSEEDADSIRTLAKTGLIAAAAQLSKNSERPEDVQKAFKEIKIAGSDGVVEVKVDASIAVSLLSENFLEYRQTSQKFACISNMKQIQAAVEMSLMSDKKPTPENLYGPDKYIKVEPKCPLGGSYIIKKTPGEDSDYKIICPHADKGHVLPF